MAVIGISGFEVSTYYNTTVNTMPTPDGGHATNTSGAIIDTSVKRSGSSSLKVTDQHQYYIVPSTNYYFQIFFLVNSLPASDTVFLYFEPDAFCGAAVALKTTGELVGRYGATGGDITASTNTIELGVWNKLNLLVTINAGTSVTTTIKLNDVEFQSNTVTYTGSSPDVTYVVFKQPGVDIWFDDLIVSNTAEPSRLSRIFLLLPESDTSGTGWTGGVGGTTNLFEAINNIPPIGTSSESDTTQLECASSNSVGWSPTNSYKTTLTSPSTFGYNKSASLNYAIYVCHGEDIATQTKSMVFRAVNPTFDYYNTVDGSGASFYAGYNVGALGVYPTNWAWASSLRQGATGLIDPASPITVELTKIDGTTRVASVCFIGMYVELTFVSDIIKPKFPLSILNF